MHEIGHYVLGHKEPSALAEKMADYFAGYALAPTPIIATKHCYSVTDIENAFRVSKMCAEVCYSRWLNWEKYCKQAKDYEVELLKQFGDIYQFLY